MGLEVTAVRQLRINVEVAEVVDRDGLDPGRFFFFFWQLYVLFLFFFVFFFFFCNWSAMSDRAPLRR